MPSLTTLRYLLVVCAVSWAAFPLWGSFPFLASITLLGFASLRIIGKARTALDEHLPSLGTFDTEARAFAYRYPLNVMWPDAAERWGSTWQVLGPLALFEGLVFIGRAALNLDWQPLLFLVPVTAQLFLGGGVARYFHMEERVTSDLAADKPAWDALKTRLTLRTTLGTWPPVPAPDVEEKKDEKTAS